jgi:hypothetical protein
MKKNNSSFFASVAAVMVFIISAILFSCGKPNTTIKGTNIQPCANVVCYNGGNCIDGLCNCPAGFDGPDCSQKWNARYTGNYIAQDGCDKATSYAVTITPLINTSTEVQITNLGLNAPNSSVRGKIVSNKTTIEIPLQQVNDSMYYSGIGTQSESSGFIHFNLNARDSFNHISNTCDIIINKQ